MHGYAGAAEAQKHQDQNAESEQVGAPNLVVRDDPEKHWWSAMLLKLIR